MRKKHFVLALQPHEASQHAERSPWRKTLAFCASLLFLMGFAFPACENATLAFSSTMTPENYIITRNSTANMAWFLDIVQLNESGCEPNTTSFAFTQGGSQLNNLTKINESGTLTFNHTNLPVVDGTDRGFIFSAHTVLNNGTELDTGNRTIFIIGAEPTATGGEMVGEILILAGVALIYIAFRKEKEGA